MGFSYPADGGKRDLFGLAPDGVYPATPIAQGTGELLPHLFTLIPTFVGTVSFLWHFPYPPKADLASFGRQSELRTTLPYGARTFLPSSHTPKRKIMKSDHPLPSDFPPSLFPLRSFFLLPDSPTGLPRGSPLSG